MDNPTTNTQQKTLDDLEYYQALEEKRRQINKETLRRHGADVHGTFQHRHLHGIGVEGG